MKEFGGSDCILTVHYPMNGFMDNNKEQYIMARTYVSFPDLVDVVGESDAAILCEHHGGLAFYVTQTPERSSLVGVLSDAAIESLCAEFPGIEITLPVGPHRRVLLKERIAAMLETGLSHPAIARELRCTLRYVEIVSRDLGFSKPRLKRRPYRKRQEADTGVASKA